jgi:hypothetical protein
MISGPPPEKAKIYIRNSRLYCLSTSAHAHGSLEGEVFNMKDIPRIDFLSEVVEAEGQGLGLEHGPLDRVHSLNLWKFPQWVLSTEGRVARNSRVRIWSRPAI